MRSIAGYQALTVSTAALGLTVPSGADMAIIRAETNPLRFRDDGTDPTASVGMPLLVADPPFVFNGSLSKFKAIRSGAADGVLHVLYYQP
jgi:hypothetical protein